MDHTVVKNEIFSKGLTDEELGVYVRLASWDCKKHPLNMKLFIEKFGSGKHKTSKIFKSLIDKNLLKRTRVRNAETGAFGKIVYEVNKYFVVN